MRPIDPRIDRGVAIIGPYGNVWTDRIFKSGDEAVAYLKDFWKNIPSADISGYKLAPATQTIEVAASVVQEPLIEIDL